MLVFALIIHDRNNRRIAEVFSFHTAWLFLFHLPFLPLPNIDHITEYLHMYIIFYIRFMFNKRNKEKRCTAFFSTNFNFFYPASRSLGNSGLLVLLYSFYLFKRQFVQYNILIIYIQNIFFYMFFWFLFILLLCEPICMPEDFWQI